MPITIQGFGTTFLGKRDFWPDGSYVTTEWFVFCLLPIYPLGSFRVRENASQSNSIFAYPVFHVKESYSVLDEKPSHRKQVLCVYLFAVFYVTWTICLSFVLLDRLPWIMRGYAEIAGCAILAAIALIPWLLVWRLRDRARRWRPGFK